jgi:hypothetical protein
LDWVQTTIPPGWFDASGLRRMADPALSVTFMDGDTYCGSAGLFKLWGGVYEAWLVLAQTPANPWEFLYHLRRSLRLGERLTRAHRLQAYCLASYEAGQVVAHRCGFEAEGIMRAATPDRQNMILYAKVRP